VHRVKMTPEQFLLGGRNFGTIFLWVLAAGEIYTIFTFLGAPGWAYGKGAPSYYILSYGTIGFVIGYFLVPQIWRVGNERNLLTAADFFVDRFNSRRLGAFVGSLHFFMIVPYVTLQLTGMQILLTIAGYGAYDTTVAVAIGFLVIAFFVFTVGLRGTAWASVIKDALILAAVLFAGITLPVVFFGSPAAMFDHLLAAKPGWLTLHDGGSYPPAWFVSTVLLQGMGFFMGPHNIAAIYSAKSGDVLRRNMMILPVYSLVLLMIFFAGFTALVVMPGLKGTAADTAFVLVVQRHFPPWVLGAVAGTGCLAALIPVSAHLLGASSALAKNVLGDLFGIGTSERGRTRLLRALVLIIAVMAVALWIKNRETLVGLLLLYYNGITQMFPGFVFGLAWRRVGAAAIAAGIVVGLAVAFLPFSPPFGLNSGAVALVANVLTVVAITLLLPARKAHSA